MQRESKPKIDLKIQRFCSHCNNNSIQEYLLHHFYDRKQGGLWDREVETVKEPGAYFVFHCKTCEQVLLYDFCFFTPPDEREIEGFLSYQEHNGMRHMGWDENVIKSNLEPVWPRIYEEIHRYVPESVKKCYLKALKNIRSPLIFVIEIRKALEAICEERDISSQCADGRNKDLKERINELCQIAMLPPVIKDIAHKIRITGNLAAHKTVTEKDIPVIRNFFRV